MLQERKILIGITASISAYKIILLVRYLVKAGAEVRVILTPSAKEFVSEITLATLSKNPVASTMIEEGDAGEKLWNNHVELGEWADLFLVAPTSANTLSKMVQGACDNLLMATYLSARCPVWFAPAMDLDMYQHESTQHNIQTLMNRGQHMIPPGSGELASGLVGEGRLAEPEDLFEEIKEFFLPASILKGKKVLVTAGPTYEYIDPVRFIGNPSTGKMGYALAHEAAKRGAVVTLVSGPVSIKVQDPSIQVVKVTSAEEMYLACEKERATTQLAIMSAAVADYTPVNTSESKMKKGQNDLSLVLRKTKDILAHWGAEKLDGQVLIGFAMETDDLLENAQLKLNNKNADLIVLNSLREKGAGFAVDTNRVSIVSRTGDDHWPLLKKEEVAVKILLEAEKLFQGDLNSIIE